MLERINKLRKAPEPVKERVVGFITILAVIIVTAIWFFFSVPSFFKKGSSQTAPSVATSTSEDAANVDPSGLKAPFGG
jgi:hypothetical protein